ncbi:MAG TPA: Asp-tRNA(Asn)/Glu-tRNA(Gln) amidotransferase subunit GatA [Opitutales bacterium]|nr:Asp-tRNA(Asn)/Glu-tRNA(Gln) amidotransferase subunit GatA [Opitutales bacterium]
MSEALHTLTLAELSRRLAARQVTSEAVTRAFIERAQAVEPKVRAFLHRDEADALAQAKASDARRAAGKTLGPLDGVPIGIKDVIAVKGQPLTGASKILEKFVSPYDATVTEKLHAAGVVLWGRLNLDEFAMGSSTENSAYQTTGNPWDLERIPGGSSGGSAAAVAAGEAPAALGSDTGGSIRQPAALCGIVGLKPTYGLVSRYGLMAFASSLDQIGPMTHTTEDAAMLLQVLAGHDRRDSTSLKQPVPDYVAAVNAPAKPWTLGVPRDFFGEGIDPEVRASIEAAIKFYESKGCKIVDIKLPHADLGLPVYYIIATAEASSNLARYDGIRYTHRSAQAEDAVDIYFKSRAEGFGPEVKRRIILGTYVLSSGYYDAYYLRAQKVRTLIRRDFENAFQEVDAVLTPTAPTAAFKRGEKTDDPLAMYLSDIYTISVNLAGLPGLSLPCGFTKNNLPIGLQLIGRPFAEADLLALGHMYEAAHDWHSRRAQL